MSTTPAKAFSVYKNKPFARFAKKARITDGELWAAAGRANEGFIDADLGGGVIKQRIARSGEGKSGGSRALILIRRGDRAIFVFGFEKKDMANIDARELLVYRKLAEVYLGATRNEILLRVREGVLSEVNPPGGGNHG